MEEDGGSMKDSFSEVSVDKMSKGRMANQCSQCNYTSLSYNNVCMKNHLEMHSGEKTNKCSQCSFASCWPGALRVHLKIHSGEKSTKCNQCDFASSQAGHLRRHFSDFSSEKSKKIQPTLHSLVQTM